MNPRHGSWWERGLDLESPSCVTLPADVDVLIVGAGFTGGWLAYHLSQLATPPSTLVLERDAFSYGASSRNAGFLTCGQLSEMQADVDAVGLDAVVENFLKRLDGMAIVRSRFPELAVDTSGSLDWDPLTDAQRQLARHLNEAAGEEVYRLGPARVGGQTRDASMNLRDSGLDPVDLLIRLRGRSTATFAFGAEVTAIGDGRAQVQVADTAREVRYGHAFVATNAFASVLHPGTPVQPGRGQVIITTPVTTDHDRTLGYMNQGYDYFRWIGDRLLLGGGRHRHPEENGPTDLSPTDPVRDYLLETARVITGDTHLEVEHHWAGIMGFHEGRHLGGSPRERLDGTTDVVAGFGGMGVALTPAVTAAIVAEMA